MPFLYAICHNNSAQKQNLLLLTQLKSRFYGQAIELSCSIAESQKEMGGKIKENLRCLHKCKVTLDQQGLQVSACILYKLYKDLVFNFYAASA